MAVSVDEQMERDLREVFERLYEGPEEDFWPLVYRWLEDGRWPYFDRWLEHEVHHGHECAVAECVQALRELVADINAPEIVSHVVPYYKGWQVDGEWLDAWHDAVERELNRLEGSDDAWI